jgi:hypothetical protein
VQCAENVNAKFTQMPSFKKICLQGDQKQTKIAQQLKTLRSSTPEPPNQNSSVLSGRHSAGIGSKLSCMDLAAKLPSGRINEDVAKRAEMFFWREEERDR